MTTEHKKEEENKITTIIEKPKLNIDEFIGLTGVKKGRVLFKFDAIGKNELSVSGNRERKIKFLFFFD